MYPQKVKLIVSDAPFHTVEGIPYGKKKINFNQPIPYIARDVATYFGGNLYGYQMDEISNSLLVILTNARRIRIHFEKEIKHDNQEEQQQERGRYACSQEDDSPAKDD